MNSQEVDGGLQIASATALLAKSHLVDWDPGAHQFVPITQDIFEYAWRKSVDPVFGRTACWILFAAGAEYFLKGVCLLNSIDFRELKTIANPPEGNLAEWAPRYLRDWKFAGTRTVHTFKTLGNLTYETNGVSTVTRLFDRVRADPAQRDLVLAALKYLANSIRNRDMHAYILDAGDADHALVLQLFSRALNILATWLPRGPASVTALSLEARQTP